MIKKLTKEERYIRRRLRLAKKHSKFFYYFRKYPINHKKIVFTTIEGTTGFSCNPKYIALELLNRRNDLDLVWLVDDMNKQFPVGIRKVKNTIRNRAYELTTAAVWVDNSRKQLEVRKREGQFYIQTWHASMGIKQIGLYRGATFSKIARLVSEHDSSMIDLLLTNSSWKEKKVEKALLYHGDVLRSGSPRVDILLKNHEEYRHKLRKKYNLPENIKLMMYAPTFRSGSQATIRKISVQNQMPDFKFLIESMEMRFGAEWAILLRLHPQLTARHITANLDDYANKYVVDISGEDDMSECLAACDALLSDYSAITFDAAYMRIPVFLYVYDLDEFYAERGIFEGFDALPFPSARNDLELAQIIKSFDENLYLKNIEQCLRDRNVIEDGKASVRVADVIEKRLLQSTF